MPGRSAPEWVTLRARVPRGFEDFWALMRDLDAKHGTFTASDVVGETNVQRQSVEHYIARLVAGGFVRLVGRRRLNAAARINVYSLTGIPGKKPKLAPRLREDGTIVAATTQELLWRAMRALKAFSTAELAFAATVDRPVPRKTAQRYLNELARAGYLTVAHPHGLARPALYRLKPAMNTGPKPPSVLVTEAVWDRNLNQIMGEPLIALAEGGA